jgi:virginiamycin B lyase
MSRTSRAAFGAALALVALAPPAVTAQASDAVAFTEWTVPFGGHPRDPMVAPDGSVFFVGQRGNYIAQLNPRNGEFKQFAIDSGTFPHNLVVDRQGMVWYAGNRNGMIGKLNPATGAITRYPMPDESVRDPHTLIFDAQGNIWFTAQQSNAIGHLNTSTGAIRLVKTGDGTRPYGIVLNSRGVPWVNLFGTNKIAKIDPATMAVTTYDLPHERARDRRIALTSDDVVWYTDYTRGFLGRLDPATGAVREFPMPGGAMSLPYGMAVDDKDRLWVTESGRNGVVMYGFDPKTNGFFGRTPIGRQGENNTIRHMYFDRSTGLLWFGTDQGTVGRAEVSRARTAM